MLSVSRLIPVTITLTQKAAANRGFGTLLLLGNSDVITPSEKYRSYTNINDVAADFGTDAEEYKAAQLYFAQDPAPTSLMIARWVSEDAPAILKGAILTTAEQNMELWSSIKNGSFIYTINGTDYTVKGVDLTRETNLNGVASKINEAINSNATIEFDGGRFTIKTNNVGEDVTIGYLKPAAEQINIHEILGLQQGTAAQVNGTDGTSGTLTGGVELDVDTIKGIKNGNFKIAIDSAASTELKNLDFSSITTLNDIATIIGAKLTTANVTISSNKLKITSKTTGTSSTVGYGEGIVLDQVDLSSQLKMTKDTATVVSDGVKAETILDAVSKMCIATADWYGLVIAVADGISNDDLIEVAQYIESQNDISRVFGITETDTRVLDAEYTDDLASRCHELSLDRTAVQYSQNKYAICSFFGRAFTVNFNGNMTCITLMYKQEPSVVAEDLTETQAQTLQNKHCNVFTKYNNDTSIIQYGTMAGDMYFDERHGADWLQNYVQTNVWNQLYTTTTKIGQDDAGMNEIVAAVNDSMIKAKENGYIGAGTWNSNGFGQLKKGDYLVDGYYVYCPPMSTQSQADREQRKAVPIQVAGKLLGAIHTAEVAITLNR